MLTPDLSYVHNRKKRATKSIADIIEMKIYFDKKCKYLSTGIKVNLRQWKNNRVVNHEDQMVLNATLDDLMSKARMAVNNMVNEGIVDITEIKQRVKSMLTVNMSFYEYCDQRTTIRTYGKCPDTKERYFRFLRWFHNWGLIKSFGDITERNIIKMDECLKKTGMKPYSIWNNYHRILNSFILDAVADGYLKRNPYKWVHINRDRTVGLHKFLTKEEFENLMQSKMPTKSLERVRDLFVFQTLTCLSYTDLASFSLDNLEEIDGNMVYKSERGKTGINFTFTLLPKAMDILKKYEMKLPVISNIKYNEYLKLVAHNSGIDKPLTSHWARHTGATLLLNEGHVDMEVIARILGHTSTQQTRATYAKVLDKTIVKEMSKLKI